MYPFVPLYTPPYTSTHLSMYLHTSTYPSMQLLTPLHTPLCTSAHLFVASVHLCAPLCKPMHFSTPMCTFAHLCAPHVHLHAPLHIPPCTYVHPAYLCLPCIPLCNLYVSLYTFSNPTVYSSVHHCIPPHTSVHLHAPLCINLIG